MRGECGCKEQKQRTIVGIYLKFEWQKRVVEIIKKCRIIMLMKPVTLTEIVNIVTIYASRKSSKDNLKQKIGDNLMEQLSTEESLVEKKKSPEREQKFT